mmetsp:Transcript_14490/g.60467  ORF Transcript_14490/g.60467 Transcript_14490/m.60467 type:complete len:240 (+) Transcript_14490:577-1296(+)
MRSPTSCSCRRRAARASASRTSTTMARPGTPSRRTSGWRSRTFCCSSSLASAMCFACATGSTRTTAARCRWWRYPRPTASRASESGRSSSRRCESCATRRPRRCWCRTWHRCRRSSRRWRRSNRSGWRGRDSDSARPPPDRQSPARPRAPSGLPTRCSRPRRRHGRPRSSRTLRRQGARANDADRGPGRAIHNSRLRRQPRCEVLRDFLLASCRRWAPLVRLPGDARAAGAAVRGRTIV